MASKLNPLTQKLEIPTKTTFKFIQNERNELAFPASVRDFCFLVGFPHRPTAFREPLAFAETCCASNRMLEAPKEREIFEKIKQFRVERCDTAMHDENVKGSEAKWDFSYLA